ncbi:c-di-GMP-binding flagellar brake protein YcgR, contains PilZNR and PilZ domains [Anaerovirgula multivorans]|uniref:C-di-GMP-binding flagellar brake protein YcgR, contains PilZNR and PilZ domains n=1 Tax=Anaerovirgula multivorans TaxID=312168 RepID=A0A239A1A3_9FIRM|nr:PilZ domain-containing protein [Anaerovirgula multivorans]SNR89437.1 c-di-GMP-binding flagellar brake protein YcgR, contains PilZNR and PilZ domains [Anaerovirgula multivorans]
MNLLTELKIGEKIEIEPVRLKNTIISRPIVSQVIEIRGDKVFIANPIKKGMPYLLHQGQQISIMFYRDEKGIFSFTGEVIQRLELKLPVYIIKPITPPEKIQRRLYFRLKVLTKVVIRDLNDNKSIEIFTKDISGGGLKAITKKAFEEKQKVECIISLNNNNTVTVVGEIVRVEKEPTTNEYEIGVRYIDISDSARNQIIAFVFRKQRELRQKGLI